jgi:hypothetical protein
MKKLPFTVVNPVKGLPRKVRFSMSYRFVLEPVHKAQLEQQCIERGISISVLVREAVAEWLASDNYKPGAARGARYFDTYGKLSPEQFSVRFTPALFHAITMAADRLGYGRRGISAMIRLAVTHKLTSSQTSCGDATHQAQSPAPASEDTLPRQAS